MCLGSIPAARQVITKSFGVPVVAASNAARSLAVGGIARSVIAHHHFEPSSHVRNRRPPRVRASAGGRSRPDRTSSAESPPADSGPRASTRGTSSSGLTRDLARPWNHARTWGDASPRAATDVGHHTPWRAPQMNDTTGAVAAPPENRILRGLPAEERDQLAGLFHHVSLPAKTVLFEPGQVICAVHFPLDGVISLVTPLGEGAIVEVATIGNEGIVGVPLVAGGSLAVRAIAQVGGHALRMDADAFMAELDRLPGFRRLVRRYIQALFGQISQAAACNRLHSNEERLSRWLLMSHDRVGTDTFPITHEFLGQMLGSRRARPNRRRERHQLR